MNKHLILDMSFDESCGIPDTACTCYDCETYFNPNVVRPIKGDDITDEHFNEMLEFCTRDTVIQKMKSERYRSYIYEVVPYPMWKLLKDPEKYQAVLDKIKSDNVIPDDDPEICRVGILTEHRADEEEPRVCTSISYRFPSSTVKYDLSVYQDGDRKLLKTHGRGSSEVSN